MDMDEELDRIADIVAERIRAQLGDSFGHSAASNGSCGSNSDSCGACGHCATKRSDAVRTLQQNGADRVGATPGVGGVAGDIAMLIDHTLLKPDASVEALSKLCREARQHNFASVCVNTGHVARCKALLADTPVKVCAVVGFPLGAMASGAKAYEARDAVRAGAEEIDMVLNIGALKDGNYAVAVEDIRKVVSAAAPAKVKVILETGMLNDEQKVAACTLAKLAGAHFVKTSTGFGKGGATAEDIALMRRVVGREMGIKASGGIKSKGDVEKMVAAGATRIGASASVTIVTGGQARTSY